jgi:HAD superfamily hydrolase (TIGR01509 family)
MFKAIFADIRTVLFDLDDTLITAQPDSVDLLVDLARQEGATVSPAGVHAAHRFAYGYWVDRERVTQDLAALEGDAFWRHYLRSKLEASGALETHPHPEQLAEAVYQGFGEAYKPVSVLAPGARDVLHKVRSAGFTVGLVSNRGQPLDATTEELDIAQYFDFTLAAGEIDSWKPDAGIFRHALALAGHTPPEATLYIGDNYWADIEGARAVGMRALLVDRRTIFPEVHGGCLVIDSLTALL